MTKNVASATILYFPKMLTRVYSFLKIKSSVVIQVRHKVNYDYHYTECIS